MNRGTDSCAERRQHREWRVRPEGRSNRPRRNQHSVHRRIPSESRFVVSMREQELPGLMKQPCLISFVMNRTQSPRLVACELPGRVQVPVSPCGNKPLAQNLVCDQPRASWRRHDGAPMPDGQVCVVRCLGPGERLVRSRTVSLR